MIYTTKKMCGDSLEMREMAARICRDYLHGAWKNVTAQNIGFKHISGGLSNWLYHVWLPDHPLPITTPSRAIKPSRQCSGATPNQVLIRVYGQMHGERALEALITESVVFTLLSERGLGPQLHGVFPGGRIEEYIAARPLKTRELADRKLSGKIARKMAMIHTMEVPLSKEPRWLWDTLHRWHITCQQKLSTSSVPQLPDADFLQRLDFAAELTYLRRIVAQYPSPVVFCHNDFQEGNILLQDSAPVDPVAGVAAEPNLVLIDFEYCSYNYRGFDIANHLLEWTYDYTEPASPFYKENLGCYPTEAQQLHFIQNYLTATGSTATPAGLLPEIRAYSLASHLFWGLWAIVNAGSSQITFGYWEYAASRLGAYLRLKQELAEVPTLPSSQKRKLEETQ